MKNKEIWKDVVGYEGLYEVSNIGRVKSLNKNNYGLIMSQYITKKGYFRLQLTKEKRQKKHLVHRLVAEAFIPNPHNYPEVNHKDEDKLNNKVENLEWCTTHYNVNYGTSIKKRSKIQSKPIIQFTLDGEYIREFDSIASAEKLGFNSGGISMCCQGKYKHHKGYIWRYADD